jgi:hydroxymethylpyrimidine kinase/phosphomethylpyrimidine kinase
VSPYRTAGVNAAPGVLICAGLDPSGCTGFLADAQIVAKLGGRPVGVVTALTVQNTVGVLSARTLDPVYVREQLELLLDDLEIGAVKIGLVGSPATARTLGAALEAVRVPVVWDPLLFPSRSDVALTDSLFGDAFEVLAPRVTLLTPNVQELAFLTGRRLGRLPDAIEAAGMLAARLHAAVLLKAGDLAGEASVDVLVEEDGHQVLTGPRIGAGEIVRGTGCALSSAIATYLALGRTLADACLAAKQLVADRIVAPVRPGRGDPAIV